MGNTLVRSKCPVCKKVAKEVSRQYIHRTLIERIGEDRLVSERLENSNPRRFIDEEHQVQINLECGHGIIRPIERADETIEIVSSDGRVPFDFQWETTEFIEKAGLEGLILHEQGLGKTVIACMLLKRNQDHCLPALYICKSGLRGQAQAEIIRWTGIVPEVVMSSKQIPTLEYFPITIVSIDTLRLVRPDVAAGIEDEIEDPTEGHYSKNKKKQAKKPIWTDEFLGRYKLIIMDESQKIKNPDSSRTQAFRKIVKLGNDGMKAKVICMSGTNIEKHSGEFFVTLNAVRPELFPHQSDYQFKWCDVSPVTGKIGGIKRPEMFRELTKDFIIRYKRADVLPQLPKVFRQFRKAAMEDKDAIAEYRKVLSEFKDYMEEDSKRKTPTDILGYLSRMRHITGVAKVTAALEFIEEFLLENDDDRKLTVFLHHKRAGAILMTKLIELCKIAGYPPPLYLSAEMDLEARGKCVADFKKPENRIMLASTQAAGEGLNLQFCSDCLIMERQWNPSIEEQAEGRFPRPGSTADKINAIYLIAAGTIDDFLTKIVEEKRRNVANTLDGGEMTWHGDSLMSELASAIMKDGLRMWKL